MATKKKAEAVTEAERETNAQAAAEEAQEQAPVADPEKKKDAEAMPGAEESATTEDATPLANGAETDGATAADSENGENNQVNGEGDPEKTDNVPENAASVPDEPTDTTEDTPKTEPWEVGRVLKVGRPIIKGEDVKALQTALIARNFHCGTAGANGVYGKDTAHAVRMFQSMNRLIVDGRAGKFTVTKLGGVWKG